MDDLKRYFSDEAIKKLEILIVNLQKAETNFDADKNELFRTLHTVKGSSQTFGFSATSRLAHELENLLVAGQEVVAERNTENVFLEGISLLIKSLAEKNFELPAAFSKKIRALVPETSEKHDFPKAIPAEIPINVSSQLSNQEKVALGSALNSGKSLYVFEINFDSTDFARAFKDFRATLSESGEIIATLPATKLNEDGKIGFQILFASFLPAAQIREIAEETRAKVIFDYSEKVFAGDLQGVLEQVVQHGQAIARKFGKRIEFVVFAEELPVPIEKLKLVFDILVHLIRNAVDHGVENEGKIRIRVEAKERSLKLSVADDGRGIDLQKVKAKAVERNLIAANENLTKEETLDLIFVAGFSTTPRLTEISGRGIGLNAVKDTVEKASGKVFVKTETGKGMTFEIFLPNEA